MRRRVRIDFIAHRRLPAGGLALAAAACCVFAWQGWQAMKDSDLLQGERAGLETLRRRSLGAVAPMTAQDIGRHAQIDALARYLATPWDGLLGLLESHAGSKIGLVKFEPDASSGRIELTGRAASPQDLATYLVALEGDRRLAGVLLQRHEILRSEAGNPVEFLIGADWNATAREAMRRSVPAASSAPADPVSR